jgi:hypothetical protein
LREKKKFRKERGANLQKLLNVFLHRVLLGLSLDRIPCVPAKAKIGISSRFVVMRSSTMNVKNSHVKLTFEEHLGDKRGVGGGKRTRTIWLYR